ncbi:MAG: hypothetical protein M3O34_05065 [Chloroflexota bacterium]|nr:hypothetical protein [Chloroflexota bacterium]
MAVPRWQADGERGTPRPAGDWRALYEIEDADAVEAFVARHPGLDVLLAQVPGRIRACFDTDARPSLSVSEEPDSDSDHSNEWLTIVIPIDREWQDTQARLRRFEDEWWLDAMPRGEPLITILPRSP